MTTSFDTSMRRLELGQRLAKLTSALVLGGLLGLGATTASPRRAEAQEIQVTGPLKGAPAVRSFASIARVG